MTIAPFGDVQRGIADACIALLANVTATPSAGDPFPAMFDSDNTDFFADSRGCDYTLRYASGVSLSRGDVVTVSGSPLVASEVSLTVSEKPRPVGGGYEFIAPLVKGG